MKKRYFGVFVFTVLCVAMLLAFFSCEVPSNFEIVDTEILVRLNLDGGNYVCENGQVLEGRIDFRGAPGEPILLGDGKDAGGKFIAEGDETPLGFFDLDKLHYATEMDENGNEVEFKRLSSFRCSDSNREWLGDNVNDFFVTHFPRKNTTYTAEWESLPAVYCRFYGDNTSGSPLISVRGIPGEKMIFPQASSNTHLEVSNWSNYKKVITYNSLYPKDSTQSVPKAFPLKNANYVGFTYKDLQFEIQDVQHEIQLKESSNPNNDQLKQEGTPFTWTGGPGGGWNTSSQIHTTGQVVSTLVIPKSRAGLNLSDTSRWYVEIKINFSGEASSGYRPKIMIFDDQYPDYRITFLCYDGDANNLKAGVGILGKNSNNFKNGEYLDFPNFATFRTKNQADSPNGMAIGGYIEANGKALVMVYDSTSNEEWAYVLDIGETDVPNLFTGNTGNIKVAFDNVGADKTDIVLDRVAFYKVNQGIDN